MRAQLDAPTIPDPSAYRLPLRHGGQRDGYVAVIDDQGVEHSLHPVNGDLRTSILDVLTARLTLHRFATFGALVADDAYRLTLGLDGANTADCLELADAYHVATERVPLIWHHDGLEYRALTAEAVTTLIEAQPFLRASAASPQIRPLSESSRRWTAALLQWLEGGCIDERPRFETDQAQVAAQHAPPHREGAE